MYPFAPGVAPAVMVAGALGIALTILTYVVQSPIRLRRAAIATNVAMFAYGVLSHAFPMAMLHAALLPVNAFRLFQLERFRRHITHALDGKAVPKWSMYFDQRRTYRDGEVLFARGDRADALYFIVSGTVEIVDFGVVLHAGELFGEVAFFSEAHVRTSTAVARGAVRARTIDREQLLALYARDPVFGLYLVNVITKRLVRDVEAARAAL